MNELQLKSERLVIQVLNESSADIVLDYYQDNHEFLAPWEPVRDTNFFTRAYHQEQLKREISEIKSGRLFKVWLFKKSAHRDSPIGSVALNNIIRGCFHSCHLGYKLCAKEVNKGYMTEALSTVIDYAFDELSLHRIEANIMPRNLASLRAVEKLGFYNEGLAKQYLKINGKWEDHIHMVILNSSNG